MVHLEVIKLRVFEHLSANGALQLVLCKELHLQGPEATILAIRDLLH